MVLKASTASVSASLRKVRVVSQNGTHSAAKTDVGKITLAGRSTLWK
jgi:hypothetical protein